MISIMPVPIFMFGYEKVPFDYNCLRKFQVNLFVFNTLVRGRPPRLLFGRTFLSIVKRVCDLPFRIYKRDRNRFVLLS